MTCYLHRDRPHSSTPVCITETYTAVALPCPNHALDDDTCQEHSTSPMPACQVHSEPSGCNGHTNECIVVTNVDTCPAYSADVSSSLYTWTDDPLTTSTPIKAQHYNELKSAIQIELNRRGGSWPASPSTMLDNSRTVITGAQIKILRNGLNAAVNADPVPAFENDPPYRPNVPKITWNIPTTLTDANLQAGDKIYKDQITALRTETRYVETDCVCQCNYCTCHCYYCTCVCFYDCTCVCAYTCTCLCNYCTCVCAYECTCNCNYGEDEVIDCTCHTHSPNGADG